MAGLDRGVRPMGDWSMSMTLSRNSSPSMASCLPGRTLNAKIWRVQVGRVQYPTQKVADFASSARLDLEEKMPGILFRTATRAVAKRVASVQARHAAASATDNDAWGDVAGMLVSALGAATEKADTRQWFTLPAEVRMTRLFLPPGTQDIKLLFRDGYGNIIGEHVFEQVQLERGGRVFLHYRTAY